MPPAQTLTTLAGQALAMLGEQPLDNINSDTPMARRVRADLVPALRTVQSAFPWRELRSVLRPEDLPRAPEDSPRGIPRYVLPDDFLTVVPGPAQWWLEEDRLLAVPGEHWSLEYLRYSEDPRFWSIDLYESCVGELAHRLAKSVSHNMDMSRALREEAGLRLKQAMARQSQAMGPVVYRRRHGGSTYLRNFRRG